MEKIEPTVRKIPKSERYLTRDKAHSCDKNLRRHNEAHIYSSCKCCRILYG